MAEEKHLWRIWDNLAFSKLLHSFWIATGPAKVTIALFALIDICLIGWVMDICTKTVVTNLSPESILNSPISAFADLTNENELTVYVSYPERTEKFIEIYGAGDNRAPGGKQGVFTTLWNYGAARFNAATISLLRLNLSKTFLNIWLCVGAIFWAFKYHTLYSFIYFTISALILSLAGGAICRAVALEIARGEKPGLAELMTFSAIKSPHLAAAPMLPLSIILVIGFSISLLGLISSIKYAGELILSISLIPAMMGGVIMSLTLIGTVAGISMMAPVIAYEGSGAFDAISRTFRYIYAQPWRFIFYNFIAAVCGTISYLVVRFFVFLFLAVTYGFLSLGIVIITNNSDKLARIWARPSFLDLLPTNAGPEGWSETISSFIIHMTVLLVVGLVVAFVISFYFSASTIIYALMRQKVDKRAIDDIYLQLEQIEEYQSIDIDKE